MPQYRYEILPDNQYGLGDRVVVGQSRKRDVQSDVSKPAKEVVEPALNAEQQAELVRQAWRSRHR